MSTQPIRIGDHIRKLVHFGSMIALVAVFLALADVTDGRPVVTTTVATGVADIDHSLPPSASVIGQPVAPATVGLDPSFDGDGRVTTDFEGQSDQGTDIVIQPDGKIVAAGY